MASSLDKNTELWRQVAVAAPYLWLLIFFLAPFAIILKISLADPILAQPPYTPSFDSDGSPTFTLGNYAFLLSDKLYAVTYLRSVLMALVTTTLCLLLGFPMAYGIARSSPSTRSLLLLLIVLPFWISFLLRVYAWMGLMSNYGTINNFLIWTGLIDQPLTIMYTDFATAVGLTYSYLPFMILPLYASLERMDIDLVEAAQDLGASRARAFWDITWPLAKPGTIAGCLLVFIPAMGEYVTPYLLGGPDSLFIGRVLFDEFFNNRDWPLASAVAVVLLLILIVPIIFLQRAQARDQETVA
ncbi:MAG: ABC transporter permease subunit [Gammaproteobacteria bacterium]|nr:ABC transporter permease subunit [Gammaproteobacteria bacterium]MDH5241008.1 ABC transporter permease subunit [Gammaproteobacteria bacterium]MDH5259846.1 ABC transporter permease subunit [Gammaproteobacteria bacterium]MDH5583839.1 ABC transporter permease subunit [Gammaproteobacteria bacterium]